MIKLAYPMRAQIIAAIIGLLIGFTAGLEWGLLIKPELLIIQTAPPFAYENDVCAKYGGIVLVSSEVTRTVDGRIKFVATLAECRKNQTIEAEWPKVAWPQNGPKRSAGWVWNTYRSGGTGK